MKRYFKTSNPDKFIRVDLSYVLRVKMYRGGVRLVELEKKPDYTMETTCIFDNGWYWDVLSVKRKSDKSYNEAVELFKTEVDYHVNKLATQKHLTVEGPHDD